MSPNLEHLCTTPYLLSFTAEGAQEIAIGDLPLTVFSGPILADEICLITMSWSSVRYEEIVASLLCD